jgi:hypothetical protein
MSAILSEFSFFPRSLQVDSGKVPWSRLFLHSHRINPLGRRSVIYGSDIVFLNWSEAINAAVEDTIQDISGFSISTYFIKLLSNCFYLLSSCSFSSKDSNGLFSSQTQFLNSFLWHWVKPLEWCRDCSVETELKRKFCMCASQINAWLQVVFLFNYFLFSGVWKTRSTARVREMGVTINSL